MICSVLSNIQRAAQIPHPAHLGLDCSRQLEDVLGLSWALKLPVPGLATEVTVLVVLQRAIEGCQLAQLQPLVLIPGLVCWHQQVLYHFRRLVRLQGAAPSVPSSCRLSL